MSQTFLALKGAFTLVQVPQWTAAFLQSNRNFSLAALMQWTEENANHCTLRESDLNRQDPSFSEISVD